MNKKYLSLAIGSALLAGGSMSAHASYLQDLNLSGDFLISGIDPVSPVPPPPVTPGQFTIQLTNMSGRAEFNIPADGPLQVFLDGEVAVEYDGDAAIPDFGNTFNNFLAYDGIFDSDNITGSNFVYDFDAGIFTSDGIAINGGSFQVNYNGEIFSLISALIGIPLLTGDGAGTLDISYDILDLDGMGNLDMAITVIDAFIPGAPGVPNAWSGFENFLYILDNLGRPGFPPAPPGLSQSNGDGEIDGSFAIGQTVSTDPLTGQLSSTGSFDIAAIPTPAPLALIGLGLLGMGVARRRQAK